MKHVYHTTNDVTKRHLWFSDIYLVKYLLTHVGQGSKCINAADECKYFRSQTIEVL